MRREMIEPGNPKISVRQQCMLLCLHRSGLYYQPVAEKDENLAIMRLLDEQYYKTPFYGARRLTAWLKDQGYKVNRKRVRRLMGLIGWETLYQEPNTSEPNTAHRIYPYLLKGLPITKANQVWAMDITYVPMRKGFMYLCAVIDLHTRYVLNWSISNTMNADWCKEVVEEAIDMHGKPEIFNTDQGSQFTSEVFTKMLMGHEIQVSMDGKGRALDNIFIERLWKSVKYENIYLNVYEDGVSLYQGLQQYFNFYNTERLHQSLGYKTPAVLYTRIVA